MALPALWPPLCAQVKRKHLAVAAARRGQVYVLGCSARSDQWGPKKEALFQQIVASFRLL